MTAVFRTYLVTSELLPKVAYFFPFMAFGFAGSFTALAPPLARVAALATRHLPRRM